jgi:hypothetical protein
MRGRTTLTALSEIGPQHASARPHLDLPILARCTTPSMSSFRHHTALQTCHEGRAVKAPSQVCHCAPVSLDCLLNPSHPRDQVELACNSLSRINRLGIAPHRPRRPQRRSRPVSASQAARRAPIAWQWGRRRLGAQRPEMRMNEEQKRDLVFGWQET